MPRKNNPPTKVPWFPNGDPYLPENREEPELVNLITRIEDPYQTYDCLNLKGYNNSFSSNFIAVNNALIANSSDEVISTSDLFFDNSGFQVDVGNFGDFEPAFIAPTGNPIYLNRLSTPKNPKTGDQLEFATDKFNEEGFNTGWQIFGFSDSFYELNDNFTFPVKLTNPLFLRQDRLYFDSIFFSLIGIGFPFDYSKVIFRIYDFFRFTSGNTYLLDSTGNDAIDKMLAPFQKTEQIVKFDFTASEDDVLRIAYYVFNPPNTFDAVIKRYPLKQGQTIKLDFENIAIFSVMAESDNSTADDLIALLDDTDLLFSKIKDFAQLDPSPPTAKQFKRLTELITDINQKPVMFVINESYQARLTFPLQNSVRLELISPLTSLDTSGITGDNSVPDFGDTILVRGEFTVPINGSSLTYNTTVITETTTKIEQENIASIEAEFGVNSLILLFAKGGFLGNDLAPYVSVENFDFQFLNSLKSAPETEFIPDAQINDIKDLLNSIVWLDYFSPNTITKKVSDEGEVIEESYTRKFGKKVDDDSFGFGSSPVEITTQQSADSINSRHKGEFGVFPSPLFQVGDTFPSEDIPPDEKPTPFSDTEEDSEFFTTSEINKETIDEPIFVTLSQEDAKFIIDTLLWLYEEPEEGIFEPLIPEEDE